MESEWPRASAPIHTHLKPRDGLERPSLPLGGFAAGDRRANGLRNGRAKRLPLFGLIEMDVRCFSPCIEGGRAVDHGMEVVDEDVGVAFHHHHRGEVVFRRRALAAGVLAEDVALHRRR